MPSKMRSFAPRAVLLPAPCGPRAAPPAARADELPLALPPGGMRSCGLGSCVPGEAGAAGRAGDAPGRAVGSGGISGREHPDSFLNAGGWGETFESGHSESLPVALFRIACHVRLHLIFIFFPL